MKTMKIFFVFCLMVMLTSCSPGSSDTLKMDNEIYENIEKKAKIYDDADYKNGDVPQNEYVKLSGKIIKSDGEEGIVEKGNRFILETEGGRYQIVNGVETELKAGDSVDVFGEYYGIIKALRIDEKGGNGK